MYIVTVIPIGRGIFKEELSYYSREKLVLGTIVKAPIRSKNIFVLVTKIEEVKREKSRLKRLSFGIRGIKKSPGKNSSPPSG